MGAPAQALLMLTAAGGGGGGDANFADVVLVLNMQGTDGGIDIIDGSSYNHQPLLSGGVNLDDDTGWTPYSGPVMVLNGVSSFGLGGACAVGFADAAEFALGAEPFCMEATIYLTGYAPAIKSIYSAPIFSQDNLSDRGFYLHIYGTASSYTNIALVAYVNGGTLKSWGVAHAFSLNTEYEIRVERTSGDHMCIYVDGTRVLDTTTDVAGSTFDHSETSDFLIGGYFQSMTGAAHYPYSFNGRIARARVTIGSSRANGASSYTVETGSFYEESNSITSIDYSPLGDRGMAVGGYNGANVNVLEYVSIPTRGNVTDFGDLTAARLGTTGCVSNETRGVVGGGNQSGAYTNIIEYWTFASPGNATDFGDLTQLRAYAAGGFNDTRGLFGGGFKTGPNTNYNIIDYITIASTGNATDFGDLSATKRTAGAASSTTRTVFGGGFTTTTINVLEYVTIASTGNVTDFGDLTATRNEVAAASNLTKGVFIAGMTGSSTNYSSMDVITLATTGNAATFGHLSASRTSHAATSNGTYGVAMGGALASAYTTRYNVIDYFGLALLTCSAVDFGDLSGVNYTLGAISGN